jgi:16S rRNA (guanine527-N7)-methyltransferase
VEAGKSTEQLSELIQAAAGDVGVPLTAAQLSVLATHFRLLLQWNQKINLTAIRDPQQISVRHFAESLYLTTLVAAPCGPFVDVGSGGGFPGIPLQAIWPEASAVLLEPNQKKAAFLKEVVRQCGWRVARVLADRLEDAARSDLAGRAQLVTMRAVAPTESVLSDIAALLAVDGLVALYLGAEDAAVVARSPLFQWRDAQPIPHSDSRVISIGTPIR